MRLYDVDPLKARALAEKNECSWLDSLPGAASDMDMVLLCTPIKETPRIIRSITPHLKSEAILCEIASLKMRTTAALRAAVGHDVQPLSIHPMFGPDIKKIQGQTIVVVPVRDQDKETALARSLFPDTRTVVTDAETHDRCMASVLALPYFMNLAFARTFPSEKIGLMRKLAGTTFTVQLAVTQSIVGESPELIQSLINENIFSKEAMNRFIDECRYLRRLLKTRPHGMRGLCRKLKDSMMEDPEFKDARIKRNKVFEALRN